MKFDKVVDDLLLDFVNTKLDLYKKLTAPEVNATFKSKWFEGILGNLFSGGKSHGTSLGIQ
jgi:type I restriction enzyme R subunit